MATKKKARFVTPPNILKQKMGTGGIDPKLIELAQTQMDSVQYDFAPDAEKILTIFTTDIKKMRQSQYKHEEGRDKLVASIMQLKANGGMFKYVLLSRVADIALNFIETSETLNNDALDVLDAHAKTIKVILLSRMTGHGGVQGDALLDELDNACARYFTKHPAPKPTNKRKNLKKPT